MVDNHVAKEQEAKMATEIERKFLIDFNLLVRLYPMSDRTTKLRRGYFGPDSDTGAISVSRHPKKFGMITHKVGIGLSREEHEEVISFELAEHAVNACSAKTEKIRLDVKFRGIDLEVDIFSGRHQDLAIVEVEFDSIEAAAAFEVPPWFGREVTEDPRYSNHALAFCQELPPFI